MANPFKDLVKAFNKLLDGELSPAGGPNRLGRFFERATGKIQDAQQPYTPLERAIMDRYRNFSHDPQYHAIYVSIRPDTEGPYTYIDPRNNREERADINVCALGTCYSLENGVRLERSAGYKVVMALDIRKSPEEQIRGWKAGTMAFPDKYLHSPIITVPDLKGVLSNSTNMTGIMPTIDLGPRITPPKAAFLAEDIVACNENGQRYRAPCFIRDIIPGRDGP